MVSSFSCFATFFSFLSFFCISELWSFLSGNYGNCSHFFVFLFINPHFIFQFINVIFFLNILCQISSLLVFFKTLIAKIRLLKFCQVWYNKRCYIYALYLVEKLGFRFCNTSSPSPNSDIALLWSFFLDMTSPLRLLGDGERLNHVFSK